MRPAFLAGTFLALTVAVMVFWAHRFERSPSVPAIRIADLRTSAPTIRGIQWIGSGDETAIRITAAHPDTPVAGRFAIPGMDSVEALHLQFQMAADQLFPGSAPWEDGRFIIEWHADDPSSDVAVSPAGSIRFDSTNPPDPFVILSPNGPATPAIRLENLGRSGSFEIADLEITAVRETRTWNLVKWSIIAGWLAWGCVFVRSWPQTHFITVIAASGIWVLMAIHFAVPGPWQNQRGMVSEFKLGTVTSPVGSATVSREGSHINPGPIQSLAKLEDQGSLPLRIKVNIAKARPLLHALLFCIPTLVIAWLVGRKPALWLMIILALGIEASQLAFGYGFDGTDVVDLVTDGMGIAIGLWACGFLCHRFKKVGKLGHQSLCRR